MASTSAAPTFLIQTEIDDVDHEVLVCECTAMISTLVFIRSEAALEEESTELPLLPNTGIIVLMTMTAATTAAMVSSVVVSTLSIHLSVPQALFLQQAEQ